MASAESPVWMSTHAAADRIGIVTKTLYRIIDGGELPAYKIGRVIRLKQADVDAFIESCRIPAGTLEHLYPELRSDTESIDQEET